MARPSSQILQTPAQKKEAKVNLKQALALVKEPLSAAATELKEANVALKALTKEHAVALKAATKVYNDAVSKHAKAAAAFEKGKAKIDKQAAAI